MHKYFAFNQSIFKKKIIPGRKKQKKTKQTKAKLKGKKKKQETEQKQ